MVFCFIVVFEICIILNKIISLPGSSYTIFSPLRHGVNRGIPAVPVDRGGGGDEGGLVQQGIAMALLALALALALAGGAGYQPVGLVGCLRGKWPTECHSTKLSWLN